MRLIDADALMDAIEDGATFSTFEDELLADDFIKKAPTVEAVPVVHGRWASSQGHAEVGECYCSVCKTVYYADDLFTVGETDEYGCGQALLPNFCPHCGAKMDEVTYDSD